MNVTLEGTKLTIVVDLEQDPMPSSTGKTRIAYYQNMPTGKTYKGLPLKVAVTATIPNR